MKARSSIFLSPLLIVVVFSVFFGGCVATQDPSPGVPKETWSGEIKGMGTGDFQLKSWQTVKADKETIIQGSVKIDAYITEGGVGNVRFRGKLTGRIKDGLLEAKVSGMAKDTHCIGNFIGTISETQGFGTWKINAMDEDQLSFSGEWTLAKQ